MKWSLLALVLSFSAQAATCFQREVELETTKVTMAKVVCITDIKITIDPFKDSKAVVSYTLDGVAKTREQKIYMPIERRDGRYGIYFGYLEQNIEGGFCSETIDAKITAMLVMDRSGANAEVESVEGSVTETYDNCHSDGQEIQSIEFKKI